MGSWSVSCGFSNIAITSGNKCAIIPLKEDEHSESGGYVPATLPIFGEYNDYGGIEEIVHDENTKLIEEHYGISIDEFCEFLVDGKFTYNRSEVAPIRIKLKKVGTLDEASKLRFMWVDKNVYDVMKEDVNEYYKGYNDYGTPQMLENFGFTKVEDAEIKNYDVKRFDALYTNGKVNFYSDGKSLMTENNRYVYHFGKGDETSIETYFNVPEKFNYLKNKSKVEAWKDNVKVAKDELCYVFGDRNYFLNQEIEKLIGKINKSTLLHREYFKDLDIFGDKIVELSNVRKNLHCMSGRFYPHVLYLTPQCGEYEQHQILLDKFAEINRSYIQTDED